MHRYVINGHGWSGSSALIDYLNSHKSCEYIVIPGEFDDFRTPGTMREALTGGMPKSSYRCRGLKWIGKLFFRGCIPDVVWPKSIKGRLIPRRLALYRACQLLFEYLAFKKASRLLSRAKSDNEKKDLLKIWMDEIIAYYGRSHRNARAIFIEQFFLFDDDACLYDWFEFSKLILFIRRPSTQLAATLESKVLYNHYPWQAEFLIGKPSSDKKRKLELFLKTSMKRCEWIEQFLEKTPRDKVLVIDFDDFLDNPKGVLEGLSLSLGLSLPSNVPQFDIASSRLRNREWDNSVIDLSNDLILAEKAYKRFKANIAKNYSLIK